MESVKSIIIITDRHLCDNPRVWKEANLLVKNHYEVTVIGSWFDKIKREKDKDLLDPSIKFKAAINLIENESSSFLRLFLKGRTRMALILKKFFNVDSRWLLSYDPDAFIRIARAIPSSLILAHVETGLYAGVHLMKMGRSVAFDFEDWYSKDYLVKERPIELLKNLEELAVNHSAFVYCPSDAMAKAIALEYKSNRTIYTIYNGFPKSESLQRIERKNNKTIPSIVWFSQTIGPGRGLEFFFEALALVSQKVKVDLIGKCTTDYANFLRNLFPYEAGHQLDIRSPVKHNELIREISEYDVGLALEQDYPESRNKTITNKILQYLQAGIKVFATDTDGQREVASYFPGFVIIVPKANKAIWAETIVSLMNSQQNDQHNQIIKFNQVFSMDVQGEKLLGIIRDSISD